MERYARDARAKSTRAIDMERPQSNFRFVEESFGGLDTLRRILSQVRKHGGKTIVVEELVGAEEIIQEDEDLKTLRPDFDASRTFRLGFFRTATRTQKKLQSVSDKAFLGYAIVKENLFRSGSAFNVYESALGAVPYRHSFIKGAPVWPVMIANTQRSVQAHIYAQQNGITNCCAHAAVRTAAAPFDHGFIGYREMNRIAGIDLSKRCPGRGLDKREMVAILEAAGARCVVADYRVRLKKGKQPPAPFQKYVYGSVESGYPAIISFETRKYPDSYHGIPIIGHTFNSDTWVPSAERFYFQIGPGTRYVPSESWVSTYIGHDDNAGSHYCIPRYYFQTQRPRRIKSQRRRRPGRRRHKLRRECVAHVIATMPSDLRVNPIQAEAIGMDYLLAMRAQLANLHSNDWARRLAQFQDEGLLVLRPVLITAGEYASHLFSIRDWDHNRIRRDFIEDLREFSSTRLWMIEFSVPELFAANLRKLGEVLVRSQKRTGKTGSPRDMSSFFLARLPGHFALYERGGPFRPKFRFFDSGASGHVELFGCEQRRA